jgi:hypothetical protein
VKLTRAGGVAIAVASAMASIIMLIFGAGGSPAAATAAKPAGSRPVIVIGLAGLRWNDISASATPAIWRLAGAGSVGSLVTTTVHAITCPDDAWLTLNAGDRAAAEKSGQTPRCPSLLVRSLPGQPGRAQIPAMHAVIRYNNSTGYDPRWGSLRTAAGTGQCTTAIGQGGALALADSAGNIASYQQSLPPASQPGAVSALLARCPVTVIDLGSLPVTSARTAWLAAADRQVASIAAAAPARSVIVLAGMGDNDSPHLHAIVIAGPGYRHGLLTSGSTRQPAVVTVTDLTPSIFTWRGQAVPPGLTGSVITSSARGPLPAAIKTMIGQDTANQVYRSIVGWFFLYYASGETVLFALIAVALRGREEVVVRRRVAWYTAAAVFSAAVPAGTFLAGLVPWGQLAHPAVWLYGLGLGWAALIAAGALAGPWRKQPFGPPGFVCAVTLAVIGIDVITGSRLQLGAPFGLSLVEAGRFYGVGNNALGVYAVVGILTAAWAATAGHSRRAAVAAASAVALGTVIASGWPGFGAKVGGTIAMVPAFLVLLAAIGRVRITMRRGLLIAGSGIVLVTAFAVLDYLVPAIGPSHQGAFVGQVLHGGALGTLHRKIGSNLHSLTETWFTPVVPVVAVVTGLMLGWPDRMRLRAFVLGSQIDRLLRPALFAVWLAVVLGWLADDSGVSLAAAALPVALPLAIALVVRTVNPTVTGHVAEQRTSLCAAGQEVIGR